MLAAKVMEMVTATAAGMAAAKVVEMVTATAAGMVAAKVVEMVMAVATVEERFADNIGCHHSLMEKHDFAD